MLLILPLYLILFLIWWQFPHVINIMADVENILNEDDFSGDTADTAKKDIEQHIKRECLKSVISKDKAHLLRSKWTQEKVDKACDESINKTYAEYKQRELNEKGKKTEKTLGKHVINFYSTRISWVVKIRDVKKLQQDIENDPIIKDQMANLGCPLMYAFGNFLAFSFSGCANSNNLDLGHEQGLENDYESDLKKKKN